MKSYNQLFRQIYPFECLWEAAKKSEKGKHNRAATLRFRFHLERELLRLEKELKNKRYKPGPYRTFYVYDPKKRLISAAPYRDRVVHHTLCTVIEPLFEKSFIHDSYANRKGKGTHAAIERYQFFARKFPYVLKCDIRKFFPSIDHEILREKLHRRIRCKDTRWLIDLILDASNNQEIHSPYFPGDNLFTPFHRRRGLPIGNLTSQFWANVYMDHFDHFVKEGLRVKGYVRYVDDFVLLAKTKEELHRYKAEIISFLQRLRLLVHPNKTQIHPTQKGIPFLGYRVFPNYCYLKKDKAHRYRRYVKKSLSEFKQGKLSPEKWESGLNSWLGHVRYGNNQRLEQEVFSYINSQGLSLLEHPSRSSWRLLEQQTPELPRYEPQQEQSE